MPSRAPSIFFGAAVYVIASLILLVIGRQLEVGMTVGLIMSLVGCLVMLAIGAVPVWHYINRNRISVPVGGGAAMGAAAIALGVFVMALITWTMVQVGWSPDPRLVAADQAEELGMSPQDAEMMMQIAHPMLSGLIGVAIGAIAGAIGGAIGASALRRDERPARTEYDDYDS